MLIQLLLLFFLEMFFLGEKMLCERRIISIIRSKYDLVIDNNFVISMGMEVSASSWTS